MVGLKSDLGFKFLFLHKGGGSSTCARVCPAVCLLMTLLGIE